MLLWFCLADVVRAFTDWCGRERHACCRSPPGCWLTDEWKFLWCCQGVEQIALEKNRHVLRMLNSTPRAELEELFTNSVVDSSENRTTPVPDAALMLVAFYGALNRPRDAVAMATKLRTLRVDEDSGTWHGDSQWWHVHDHKLSAALTAFFRSQNASSVVDLGCGMGLYVRDLQRRGFNASGYDGNPDTESLTSGRCTVANLAFPQELGQWDWVISLEVAEHVPPKYEDDYVRNIISHGRRGIVLSWGNQAGHGHFNCHSSDYVVRMMRRRGLRYDSSATAVLRNSAGLPWFHDTIHVFKM